MASIIAIYWATSGCSSEVEDVLSICMAVAFLSPCTSAKLARRLITAKVLESQDTIGVRSIILTAADVESSSNG